MTLTSVFADAGGATAITGRALTLAASAGVIGACVFRWVVVRPAGRAGSITGNIERIVAGVGMQAALLLVIVVPFRVAAQASAFASPGDPLLPLVGKVLQTTWGRAALLQFVAAVAAAAGFAGAKAVRPRGWRVAGRAALFIAAVPAWMGHAAATEHWTWLAIGADIAHVAAAGGWAGGVVVLAVVTRALGRQVTWSGAAG